MRWNKSIGCLGLALTAAMNTAPAFANGGVEATQLKIVALDASAGCTRTFFQSSQHFNNTIFVVPRVVPGGGPEGKRTFDTIWLPEEKMWVLNLRLFFPRNSEELRTYGASTLKRDLEACDFDQVKWSLNSKLDTKAREEQEVRTIAPIPLTSVEVMIPGIKEIGRIGISKDKDGKDTQDVDELQYFGKSLTAQFKITPSEKEYFDNLVVMPDGIKPIVRMHYMAAHRDGSVTAKIDVAGIQQAFSAAVGGATLIAKANVAATLKRVANSRYVTITTEGTQSESLDKIQNLIIDKVLKEVSLIAESDAPKGAAPVTVEDPGQDKVSVKAVVDAISTKLDGQIAYNLISAPEIATSQVEIQVKQSAVDDASIVQVKVQSGYQDPSAGFFVRQGQTFSLTPARWWVDKIRYNEVISYLTRSGMDALKLEEHFPDITSSGMKIENRNVPGKSVMAIGNYHFFAASLGSGFWNRQAATYYWKRTEKYPERIPGKSIRILPTWENIAALPIGVSFSRAGSRQVIPFANLQISNPYFIGRYDTSTGRVMITALQDLGNVEFRELPGFAQQGTEYKEETVVYDKVEEFRERAVPWPLLEKSVDLHKDEEAIVLQKVLLLNVTRPEAISETAVSAAASVTNRSLTIEKNELQEQQPKN